MGVCLMASLSDVRFLRVHQIIGDRKRGIDPIIPISRAAWWAGIKAGRYPQGVKLGPKTTVWRAADIETLIAELGR